MRPWRHCGGPARDRLGNRGQAGLHGGGRRAARARAARRVPVHARAVPGHVPRPAVDDPPVRGLRVGRGDERALPLPPRARPDRALGRVRPADAARLRLGRPARGRRGGADRRRDRLARRHGAPLRPDPARRGLDLDDDQRAGGAPPAALRARRRGAGRRAGRRCAAPCRTTSSRSTWRAGTTSSRRGRRCGSRPTSSRTAHERLPRWNTISISGYHIREAGSTAVQELAFTLANGIAYCEAAVAAGLSPDEFGERLSFFFNAHNHFFQEVAKFRAARRLWARIMRDRFGATNPKAQALRFHAQTGGSTLTAQQPENNIVRVAVQALSAVAGGAQSIHTNGYDEALALPTERSARIALRTQQILAHEAGGHRHGRSARRRVLHRGADGRARGAGPGADRSGSTSSAARSRRSRRASSSGRSRRPPTSTSGRSSRASASIVGVNRYVEDDEEEIELHRLDPEAERRQVERTARVRAERDAAAAAAALERVRETARGTGNLLHPMREALAARCTVGEICEVLARRVRHVRRAPRASARPRARVRAGFSVLGALPPGYGPLRMSREVETDRPNAAVGRAVIVTDDDKLDAADRPRRARSRARARSCGGAVELTLAAAALAGLQHVAMHRAARWAATRSRTPAGSSRRSSRSAASPTTDAARRRARDADPGQDAAKRLVEVGGGDDRGASQDDRPAAGRRRPRRGARAHLLEHMIMRKQAQADLLQPRARRLVAEHRR